ncbi:hypothetical protein N8T08_008673 [Aspergillus melleus]|uniref:Uncharacterized protein n=1 Tax=Aspergillus melleus TaxID=138277 RepID=A0ACC3BDT6_9EURO|nr:hypothetical protein N8T08_008673 [Aspergillus melleus]
MDHVTGLSAWANFEVLASSNTLVTPREHIVVGNETGVQGRFNQEEKKDKGPEQRSKHASESSEWTGSPKERPP